MEISITIPQICLAVSGLFAVLFLLQAFSCTYVNHEIEDHFKENKALGIYWSLNLFIQFGITILASFGFLMLYLYLR